jgi:intracellular septation protein A
MEQEVVVKRAAMNRSRLVGAARWLLESFGPLIAFLVFEHAFGLVSAIVASIVLSAGLVTTQIVRDRKISVFTGFVAASVIVFGFLDLHYRTGFFIKIEPALGNCATGIFFLATVIMGRPVIIEFAEKALGRKLPDTLRGYFVFWTLIWALFFFLRAGAYVWMAYHLSIDRALVLRSFVGPVSFIVLIGAEMGVRFLRFGRRAFQKGEAPVQEAAQKVAP